MLSTSRALSTFFSDGRESSRLLAVVLAGLVSGLPAVIFGFPFFSHDGHVHAMWYSHFAEQLWAGELYPRWLTGMNDGLGSPVLFYYPPVAYYLASPLRLLFANDPHGWRQLGAAACAAQVASGLCAYLWLKRIASRNGAALAAALYVWMPYHLAFDLYRRGAYAELWTFVWMPLILYFTRGAARGRVLAAVCLALTYALLLMTHLPVTLIFSPLPVCYALYLAEKGGRPGVLFVVSGAMALGVGLSAVYLLPALTTQDYVRLREIATGFLYYEKWFLISEIKPWGSEAGYFWMAFVAAGLALCAYLIRRAGAGRPARREDTFWVAVAASCVFMMTPLSLPLWWVAPPLQKIQFPWRFNTVLCLALAPLIAAGVSSLKKPYFATGKRAKAFALILFAFWIPYAAAQVWRAYPATRRAPGDVAKINKRVEQGGDQPEYLPAWSPPLEEKSVQSYRERIERTDGDLAGAKAVGGTGAVAVSEWKPREINLHVETGDGTWVRVSQFYFPGWKARLGDGAELDVRPSAPYGLLSFFVPRGTHQVSLRLERGPAERNGGIVSAASAVVLIFLACFGVVRRSTRARRG